MSTCPIHEHGAADDGCEACQAELAEVRALLAPLRAHPSEVQLDLAAIRAQLVAPPPRRWPLLVAPGLLAAAAAVWLWAGARFTAGPLAPAPAMTPVAVVDIEPAPVLMTDPDAEALVEAIPDADLDRALAVLDAPDEPAGGDRADLSDPDAAGLIENLDDSLLDAAEAAL
jgi:hypothetical protein